MTFRLNPGVLKRSRTKTRSSYLETVKRRSVAEHLHRVSSFSRTELWRMNGYFDIDRREGKVRRLAFWLESSSIGLLSLATGLTVDCLYHGIRVYNMKISHQEGGFFALGTPHPKQKVDDLSVISSTDGWCAFIAHNNNNNNKVYLL